MATGATGATRVSGVYQMQRDTCPSGFVGEKLAQLKEGPGVPLVAMFVTNCDPLTNPRKVFKSECLARDDGFLHQGFRDAVIHVLLEAALPACILPETTFGVLGVDLLQALTAGVVAGTRLLHRCAAKRLALAVRRQIHEPQINT